MFVLFVSFWLSCLFSFILFCYVFLFVLPFSYFLPSFHFSFFLSCLCLSFSSLSFSFSFLSYLSYSFLFLFPSACIFFPLSSFPLILMPSFLLSFNCTCTVEPHYNEVLGTMKITLLYQVSHYIRVKQKQNIKSWDQKNYLVIRGFCYIRPLYNEVPLYILFGELWNSKHGNARRQTGINLQVLTLCLFELVFIFKPTCKGLFLCCPV